MNSGQFGANPPMNYGQTGVNPSLNSSQEGVNPEIAQKRLLLQKEIRDKDESLSGPFGVLCRTWFLLMAFGSGFFVISSGNRFKDREFLIFLVWMLLQSVLTFVNVGNKNAKTARGLFISMLVFSLLDLLFSFNAIRWQFDSLSLYILCCFCIAPAGISLMFTAELKNILEQRAELVCKLEDLSALNHA